VGTVGITRQVPRAPPAEGVDFRAAGHVDIAHYFD
jgi:hypothetical protein